MEEENATQETWEEPVKGETYFLRPVFHITRNIIVLEKNGIQNFKSKMLTLNRITFYSLKCDNSIRSVNKIQLPDLWTGVVCV